ncbi:hypothetical protein E5D57_011955 [Metarhizium anisopliae]|nr:hypothetical protein E5D57_011955 [Metarhizium anisopliae]
MPSPTTNEHPQYIMMPSAETSQGTDSLEVHPKRNIPTGTPSTPRSPGRREVSCESKVPSLRNLASLVRWYQAQYHIVLRMQETRTQMKTALERLRLMW